MGRFEQQAEQLVYRQDDGQITARFIAFEEKQQLNHEGTPRYRRILVLLVMIGLLYLSYIFLFQGG